jgi:hypothetical protein
MVRRPASSSRCRPPTPPRDIAARATAIANLLAYAAALVYRREAVPGGLSNDATEEALRGVLLLAQHRLEPITGAIGNSAETLYLYALGASSKLLGPSTLAIQLVSWLSAIGIVLLVIAVARRVEPSLPPFVPLLAGASSVWLFHYARVGLRAISAPFFLLLFAYCDLRAEEDRRLAVLEGIVLGVGVYAYTSFRVVPIAWLLLTVFRLARAKDRRAVARTALLVAGAAFVVSIPNVLFFFRSPSEFLSRGAYVMRGRALRNVTATLALPFATFREYDDIAGPHHYFDGVAVSLTTAGVNPVHPLVAVLFVAGVFVLVRDRAARRRLLPLVVPAAVAIAVLGPGGPSLTRMLILLPAVLVLACIGAGRLPRGAVLALFSVVIATHGAAYFGSFAGSPEAQDLFARFATPIGRRAAELLHGGRRVLCVVSRDANVVRYLTGADSRATIAEFYMRPFDSAELPRASDADVVLIERSDALAGADGAFPAAATRVADAYRELTLERRPVTARLFAGAHARERDDAPVQRPGRLVRAIDGIRRVCDGVAARAVGSHATMEEPLADGEERLAARVGAADLLRVARDVGYEPATPLGARLAFLELRLPGGEHLRFRDEVAVLDFPRGHGRGVRPRRITATGTGNE